MNAADAFDRSAPMLIAGIALPESGGIGEERRAEAATAVRKHMEANRITVAGLARSVGLPLRMVDDFVSGRDTRKLADAHVRAINSFVELDARRRKALLPGAFVWTCVATAFRAAAEYIHRVWGVGLVYAPTGCGKSVSAEAVAELIPGTIYTCVGTGDRSLTGIVRRVHEGVSGKRWGPCDSAVPAIMGALAGAGRTVMIDQAHKLSDRALEFLFDLHDGCQCPLLLIGTVRIRQRLDADVDPAFGQMASRVDLRCNLVREAMRAHGGDYVFSCDEVRQVLARDGLRLSVDAVGLLAGKANLLGHGSLRLAARLARSALGVARKRGQIGPDGSVVVYSQDVQDAETMLDDPLRSCGATEAPERAARMAV